MVLHEGAEEILATTDCCLPASPGKPDCFDLGVRCCAVYLYAVLGSEQ
jgi:hypothetical protein